MELRVSSPGNHLSQTEIDGIEKDLEKIDRRLQKVKEVLAEVRVTPANANGSVNFQVTLEVKYRRTRLIAKAGAPEVGPAVREAREEILRQINDRSPGSHSSYAKGR